VRRRRFRGAKVFLAEVKAEVKEQVWWPVPTGQLNHMETLPQNSINLLPDHSWRPAKLSFDGVKKV